MNISKQKGSTVQSGDSPSSTAAATYDLEHKDPSPVQKPGSDAPTDEKKAQQIQGHASVLTSGGNIEKIRDILFGTQMREYDKRFSRLEDRMRKEVNDLKEDLRKNFESLESFIKREIELLSDRLQKEQNERYSAVKEVAQESKEASSEMERRIVETEDHINKKVRELNDQLLALSKQLSEEIQQKHEALSASLDREAQELRGEKVDRANLSELLMEMALRINKTPVDFDVAANELLNE